MESKIKQAADEINIEVKKKVGADEVISKINMTPETIKIIAKCIDVDGVLDLEKLNALKIKAGSVNAEDITGTKIFGKEFLTLERKKLEEDVIGLYIGSDGFDFCWNASNAYADGVYGHARITGMGFFIIVNNETVMSFSPNGRIGGGSIGGPYARISRIVYDQLFQMEEQ